MEAAEAPGTPTAEAKRPSLLAPQGSSLDPASPPEAPQQPAATAAPEDALQGAADAGASSSGSAAAMVEGSGHAVAAEEGAAAGPSQQQLAHVEAAGPSTGTVPEQGVPEASPAEPGTAPALDEHELEREAHLAQVSAFAFQEIYNVL